MIGSRCLEDEHSGECWLLAPRVETWLRVVGESAGVFSTDGPEALLRGLAALVQLVEALVAQEHSIGFVCCDS